MSTPTPAPDADLSPWVEEQTRLTRMLRQRLESLQRAGLDRLPMPAPRPPRSLAAVPAPARPAAPPRTPAAPPARPAPAPGPVDRPTAPTPAPAARPAPTQAPRPTPPATTPAPPPRPGLTPAAALATTGSLFEEPKLATAVPAGERAGLLAQLSETVAGCARCPHLAASRTQTVFGEGSPTARLMFVGEAPGADEDATGRPFVGRAGALLTDMITKGMGLDRSEVYIANVLKSRPPENRNPLPDEIAHCLPYLERQVEIIQPQFLCLLGKIAASALLETALPISKLRGKWHRYRGIPTIVTYHPSYLLRNPAGKKDAWADLQALMLAMGVKPPDRRKPG